MLSKDQIEEWERSEEYWSEPECVVCDGKGYFTNSIGGTYKCNHCEDLTDPYDDAPVVDDAYKQDFSKPKAHYDVTYMVADFMHTTGQTPDSELYATLIDEEYQEWQEESYKFDHEAQLKELADLTYVIYAYAVAMGWNLDEAIYRVHRNNLARVVQHDGSIWRREDGKVIKREDAPKVNLKGLI